MSPSRPDIDALILNAAASVGMEAGPARLALVGALGLLEKHAERGVLRAFYDAVPGAEALAASPDAAPRPGGGLFGGLMRNAGGLSGAAMADAMGLLNRLQAAGLDRDALKPLVTAARGAVQAATGRDLLGDAVKSVRGVGSLIGG